jgi:hypothetical protein
MIMDAFFTRKPIHRVVEMYFGVERTHLEESLDVEDMIEWTDDELYNHCMDNNIDHIWLDLFILNELIKEDEDEDEDIS